MGLGSGIQDPKSRIRKTYSRSQIRIRNAGCGKFKSLCHAHGFLSMLLLRLRPCESFLVNIKLVIIYFLFFMTPPAVSEPVCGRRRRRHNVGGGPAADANCQREGDEECYASGQRAQGDQGRAGEVSGKYLLVSTRCTFIFERKKLKRFKPSSNVKSTIFQDRKLPFCCFRSKKDRM